MSSPYTAVCECGRSNTVEPSQMGGRHPCHCGFMLVMPTADEFQRNPVQKAYPSVLRKVYAQLEAGLLPGESDCQGCGTPTDREVDVLVVCESSRTETVGATGVWAALLLVFTILFLPVIIFLRPDPGVTEHHGRDTSARVPVCLCEACQRRLTSRWIWPAVGVVVGGVALAALVGAFVGWWWAIIPVVVALPAAGLMVRSAQRRRVKEGRQLLTPVPAYAELLKAYRFAEVHVPRA